MDRYEATKVVFTRIQKLDPENASKIMGLLLIQDHGEKEMIRLAFGPENLLHSVILKARQDLGGGGGGESPNFTTSSSSSSVTTTNNNNNNRPHPLSTATPTTTTTTTSASNSPRYGFLPNGLKIPPSLSISNLNSNNSPSSIISPSSISWGNHSVFPDFHNDELLFSPNHHHHHHNHHNPSTPNGTGVHLQDHLNFVDNNNEDSLFTTSSSPIWTNNNNQQQQQQHHRRSYSVSDISFGSSSDEPSSGWKPCLYYARGFCKNGSGCRFVHHHNNHLTGGGGGGDSDSVLLGGSSPSKAAEVMEHCHELLRSKSLQHQKLLAASHLMAAAAAGGGNGSPFSYSGSGGNNINTSSTTLSFLENQRVAAAAALMMGEDMNKFTRSSSRLNNRDYFINGNVDSNPSSRQIYLTFPADSTFREEDVSNYFSIFGPVQDVRIPYQQKRMFGFVTFCYPETVRLILAKGNPHFVCDARVLVKPYKEKGKVPDKYRKQQLQQLERELEEQSLHDNPFDHPFGGNCSRMMYSNAQDLLWRRRKLEEEQADIQQQQQTLVDLQTRRLMSLTLDTKRTHHHHHRALSTGAAPFPSPSSYSPGSSFNNHHHPSYFSSSSERSSPDDASSDAENRYNMLAVEENDNNPRDKQQGPVKEDSSGSSSSSSGKESTLEDNSNLPESLDHHNLPDSPFASSTKGPTECFFSSGMLSGDNASAAASDLITSSPPAASTLFPTTSTLDMGPFKSCYFQMPSLSSGHGAIGM